MAEINSIDETAIFQKEFQLLTNDVDINQNAKPSAILNIFQEVAVFHAEQLNVNFNAKTNNKYFWVLSRIKYEVIKTPRYHDFLKVVTWPIRPNGAYYERDYEIYDKYTNKLLVKGTSIWCILSLETHKLIPAKTLDILNVNYVENRRAFDEKISKIEKVEQSQKIRSDKTIIKQSQIDFNGHVNNTKYADLVFDAFDKNYCENKVAKSFQLSYTKEVFCDEEIVVDIYFLEENKFVVKANNVSGEEVFSCQTSF